MNIYCKKVCLSLAVFSAVFLLSGCSSSKENGCPNGCTSRLEGCDIKGNISLKTGEKIYHIPSGQFYSATQIDSSSGERWFCNENEAMNAGWRKSER